MKRLFYYLIALPVLAFAAMACDDDKAPNVDVMVNYRNATVSNGTVYVVKGDTLVVDSLYVTAVNTSHKATIVGPVSYYFNGLPIGRVIVPPYKLSIPTDDLDIGAYKLQMNMTVAEEDYPLGICTSEATINVVSSTGDVPSDPAEGPTLRIRTR